MFSATGNILTGSQDRPDIITILESSTKRLDRESPNEMFGRSSTTVHTSSTNCRFNRVGYIPGISTFTGCARALLGIVHSIVHLVCTIFDSENREKHLQEAKLGGRNIARGFIEMIPVIGNITMFVVDLIRIRRFEEQVREIREKNPEEYDNQTTLFIFGKEIAKRPTTEVNKQLAIISKIRTPNEIDIVNIIQNKV